MDITKTYTSMYPQYLLASEKLKGLIQSIIANNAIEIHTVTCRAKTIQSYTEKAKKYHDPLNEIQDYIGIRIITYVEDDTVRIANILEKEFDIDKKNSGNKSEKLGSDKVGYKSIHLIAKISEVRAGLSEYSFIKDMIFEIQIRTILQHTWAEIEHDRNYKFHGVLPIELKRRFNILSGVLELVDKEFNDIANQIDVYQKDVVEDISKNDFNIELTSASVFEYCSKKFKKNLTKDQLASNWNKASIVIIDELSSFGFSSIEELDVKIDSNVLSFIEETRSEAQTLIGVLRDIMMIIDTDKYFSNAFKQHWNAFDDGTANTLIKYAPKVAEYIDALSISRET